MSLASASSSASLCGLYVGLISISGHSKNKRLCVFRLCLELFDMKTRYEESDNIVVRATRTVTDKMSELFGEFCDVSLSRR